MFGKYFLHFFWETWFCSLNRFRQLKWQWVSTETHPYKHKFYCFVVPNSGVKYLFYLHPFSSKVYKNPFVQSITILICIGWTSPYDVPVTPLPSSPLPLLLVLFQLVSFIREIPTKQSTSKLFESINNSFFSRLLLWLEEWHLKNNRGF